MYEEIYAQAKQACNELCDVAKLKEGSIVVTVRQLASNTKISKIILQARLQAELSDTIQVLKPLRLFSRVYTKCFAKEKFTLPHNAVNISIVQSSLSERLFRTLKS